VGSHSEIADRIHRFFRALDVRDYDTVVRLVAEDGVWHRQGKALTRATIPEAMAERSATMVIRHVVSNLIVDGDETVEASFLLTVYRSDSGETPSGPLPLEGPAQISDCTATLVQTTEGWRFSRLSVPPPVLKRP
jgi:hypothetical protein